jgi:hypothetical protein
MPGRTVGRVSTLPHGSVARRAILASPEPADSSSRGRVIPGRVPAGNSPYPPAPAPFSAEGRPQDGGGGRRAGHDRSLRRKEIYRIPGNRHRRGHGHRSRLYAFGHRRHHRRWRLCFRRCERRAARHGRRLAVRARRGRAAGGRWAPSTAHRILSPWGERTATRRWRSRSRGARPLPPASSWYRSWCLPGRSRRGSTGRSRRWESGRRPGRGRQDSSPTPPAAGPRSLLRWSRAPSP